MNANKNKINQFSFERKKHTHQLFRRIRGSGYRYFTQNGDSCRDLVYVGVLWAVSWILNLQTENFSTQNRLGCRIIPSISLSLSPSLKINTCFEFVCARHVDYGHQDVGLDIKGQWAV